MSSRRRNGQAASCEPCRKDKVRCDHGLPVCGRCQKRNTTSRCFYHPAPLTREVGSPVSRFKAQRTTLSAKERRQKEAQKSASPAPSSVGITIQSPGTDRSLLPGYFGPTSFVLAFSGSSSTLSSSNDDPQPPGNEHSVLPSYWVTETTKMLSLLTEGSIIEQLVHDFYGASQFAVIPTRFIYSSMAGMKGMMEEAKAPQTSHKTTQILESTAQRFRIPPNIRGKDFHKLFTGIRMRLEIIGIVYAIAGRASIFGLAQNRFLGSAGAASAARFEFARKMLTASDTAIQVCKILTPVNDLTTWLLFENWQLSCMFHGDSSSPTWHRLGELSSCIFELGLHRDCHKTTGIPTFLQDIRRRLFAALYHVDKNIATFFGRPPHVSWRYSDSKPPLDISEDALLGDEQDFRRALEDLDSEGWNNNATIRRASWHRLRYFITPFREEILELSLRSVDAGVAENLRDISFRCTKAWSSIPAHLRYSSHNWNDNHPVGIRTMLLISYLLYLYNVFLIQRLLTQHEQSAEIALLDVSSEILSVVLMLGRQQEPMIDIQRDYNSTLVLYGFSSASTLIKALQTQVRTGHPIPYTGSRAELIRNLSVFISHIEAMARPLSSNINHALFERASKMFTNILDEVLESRLPVSFAVADTAEGAMGVNPSAEEDLAIPWAADGMEFLDTLDFGAAFDQWVF
ncbi:hypothetical protein BDW62DRAFT_189574 [Aspergillus aurantiobrunneus]